MAVTPTFPSRESLRRLRFRPVDVGVGVAGAELDDAERIASQHQPHGLGIDRDRRRPGQRAIGQVAFVQMIGQRRSTDS